MKLENKDLNHGVLVTFLPDKDIKNFIVFDHVIIRYKDKYPFEDSIHLLYRCPSTTSVIVKTSDYLQRIREQKLSKIID